MFNTNLQRMRQIGVEFLYFLETLNKPVDVGSIDPFGLWLMTAKNCTNLLLHFVVIYLGCVITKINKSQKISTSYVKYILFFL